MNNTSEKIEIMKEERVELLRKVRDQISQKGCDLSNHVSNLIEIIDFDEKSIKKYEAIVSAKNLIEDLSLKIVNSNTIDDVVSIRKKLNYYINKIKNELKKRDVSDEIIEQYAEKVSFLRKEVAKFIRCLKRESNLLKIDYYHEHFDSLNEDELKDLKHLLKLEQSFNKRNLKDNTLEKKNSSIKIEEKEDKDTIDALSKSIELELSNKDSKPLIDELYDDSLLKLKDDDSESIETLSKELASISNANVVYEPFMIMDFLKKRVETYQRQYSIVDTYDYSHSLGKNIFNFIRNIPRNIINKRYIKNMESDWVHFYCGNDFTAYIEYSRKRNSIKEGFKRIFHKSRFYSKENEYLDKHEDCVKWISDFLDRNSLDVLYSPKMI